ncbi:hypothetical protein [Natronomonas sp. EA1]|uniref:hypothetical protein n=1 Tax=Natronomonas sp. EA1 TaxID=3421655 RepID=UPI003EB95150
MAGVIDLVYAGIAVVVAVLGVAFVLFRTSDATGTETTLSNLSLVAAVALFLAATAWTLV